MKKRDPDVLDQTISFWTERTGRSFSREEAREMNENVSGFIQILEEWDRKSRNIEDRAIGTFEQDESRL